MTDQLRAEWIKLRSVRTTWVLTILFVAFSAALVALGVFAITSGGEAAFATAGLFPISVASWSFFLSVMGVLAYGSEYRHGTVRVTYAATPTRHRVATAKIIVYALFAGVTVLVASAIVVGIGYALLAADGSAPDLDATFFRTMGGLLLYCVLAMLAGVGIGAMIRNSTFAIVSIIVAPSVLEGALVALLPNDLGKFLPFFAGSAMYQASPIGRFEEPLTPLAGGVIFAVWVAVLLGVGIVIAGRRDTH